MRAIASAVCVSVGILALGGSANSQENSFGQQLFKDNCAVCHGDGGKGDGPIANVLNVPPADLTAISKKNNGEFPYIKVYHIVDGRSGVRGHGNEAGAMPIWGERISREIETGDVPFGAEVFTRARLIALVDYIESIQQK